MKKMLQKGGASKPKAADESPKDWEELLVLVKVKGKKRIAKTAPNVTVILRHHPNWHGIIAYDEFLETIVTTRAPPWCEVDAPAGAQPGPWTDEDSARTVNWLAREMDVGVSTKIVEQALSVVADTRRVHPVRDWLRGQRWDRRRRLDRLVPDYLGGADTEYTRAVGPKWMISAVARVERPGCQADYALITESPEQGRRKSSAFRAMVPVPSWYSETPINIGDKDSYQNLRGVWLYGLDELDSVRRGEATKTKTFLTATRDRYRPSYARRARDFPRQNVFSGTTNEEEYFTDRRNRRYWPVRVARANVRAIERDRPQLWAEARYRFEHGEKWWPDAALERLCAAEQADRVQPDDWQRPVETWCRKNDDGDGVYTFDVLTKALRMERDKVTRAHSMRVADVLRAVGYERGEREREGGRVAGRDGRRQLRRYVLANAKERKAQTARFAKAKAKAEADAKAKAEAAGKAKAKAKGRH